MRLTAQELEQMKNVDIGAVSADALADVSGMAKERAVTAVAACSHFETKCPEASTSLLIAPGRVII